LQWLGVGSELLACIFPKTPLPSFSSFSVYNMFFVFNLYPPSLFSRLNSVGRKKGKIFGKMSEEKCFLRGFIF